RMHRAPRCITPEGVIHRGARCIRFVSARMPLAWLLALVLWIPGVIWIAEVVYKWISRNRHLLSRWFGCQGACTLMPARERANEKEFGVAPPTHRG
ncbi:MAG TPA: hypothetical protein DCM86_09935, partial [Verrucomicrobiales bacterium]|nr:hypothetical protein [Verrucomicrobiales bacterium]